MDDTALLHAYKPLEIAFQSGEGLWLKDQNGNTYFDTYSGIGVNNLGHCHPAVVQCLQQQAATLMHVSNGFEIPESEHLAKRLCELTQMDGAFFCNSGAEANETAIKLARLHGHQQGLTEPSIVVTESCFHGRTLATISAGGSRKNQAGFEPLVQGFVRAPYNDAPAIEAIAKNQKNIAAVLVEPIIGNGGILLPDAGYLKQLREICDKHNWLLMIDEVQSGMGRTGKLFAYEYDHIVPDVLCIAKALGNGIPIGACLAKGNAAELFTPGSHGSTFGGNPLATKVGLTVVDLISDPAFLKRVNSIGDHIKNTLHEKLKDVPMVDEIRGKGLMLAVALKQPCVDIKAIGLKHNILLNITAQNVIRLLPSLTLNDEEADHMIDTVCKVIIEYSELQGEN